MTISNHKELNRCCCMVLKSSILFVMSIYIYPLMDTHLMIFQGADLIVSSFFILYFFRRIS